MVKKEAFDLVYMDLLGNHKISWKGRVLNDLKINDRLYTEGDEKKYIYIVKKIIAYRRNFENISRGMSAEVIVNGDEIIFKPYTIFFFE